MIRALLSPALYTTELSIYSPVWAAVMAALISALYRKSLFAKVNASRFMSLVRLLRVKLFGIRFK